MSGPWEWERESDQWNLKRTSMKDLMLLRGIAKETLCSCSKTSITFRSLGLTNMIYDICNGFRWIQSSQKQSQRERSYLLSYPYIIGSFTQHGSLERHVIGKLSIQQEKALKGLSWKPKWKAKVNKNAFGQESNILEK